MTILDTDPDCPASPAAETGGDPEEMEGEALERTRAVDDPEPMAATDCNTLTPELLVAVAVRVLFETRVVG